MVKVNSYGIMEKHLKGNGEMAKRMDLGFGSHQKEILIKVYGQIIDRMGRDCIFILEVQSIVENLKIS
jgi:hypothetical protein